MPDRLASSIGIFGGTFDPVHRGHLAVASQIKQKLHLDQMRMMLCAFPPHRESPLASAQQRWQMLQLAVRDYPELQADDHELRREQLSYSFDTLSELREEYGPEVHLVLCLGWDSLVSFPSWHRWRELLQLCALAVVNRPHHEHHLEAIDLELQQHLRPVIQADKLNPGDIVELSMPAYPASASRIRDAFAAGEGVSSDWLLPQVARFIRENHLYGAQ